MAISEAPHPQVEPIEAEHEPTRRLDFADRLATGIVTLLPLLALGLAAGLAWNSLLHSYDVIVFVLCYIPTGLGITVGYHRLFTHRSFAARPGVRVTLAILGSMAVEGPVIEWVANHRKHHAHSDAEGDPHSPHVGHGGGLLGNLGGLWHAHLGWLFRSSSASRRRYAPDLLADPAIAFVDRTFLLWVALGMAIPFGLGYALSGTISGALTGLLWGGAVRMFLLHHVTFSINSLCHFFGRQDYETGDESRNLAWLAPLSFGEAWHNNHHAFPTSAAHGLRRQFDPSLAVIRGLARIGLAWDVVEVSAHRLESKRR